MTQYLKHEGYDWNHKRIHRIYCDLALNLRRKSKKRLPTRRAQGLAQPAQANQSWSLDFMSDSLASGRAFRTLNILDDYNREVLRIEWTPPCRPRRDPVAGHAAALQRRPAANPDG
jgi:putative transposase